MSKRVLFVLVFIVVVLLWIFAGDVISLANVQAALAGIEDWAHAHWLVFIVGFFLLYVVVTAMSLPIASLLTLLGGAVLGFGTGLVVVSLASTTGATLAFLASRYFFRDALTKRYGSQLKSLNAGIERDGAFYLYTMRMVPLFPFFLVNLLSGLTALKTRTYVLVSWIGMLPATAVYVFAGRNLAQIDSLAGILSPQMILSLSLLGIFPLLAKLFIDHLKARKVYADYEKPKSFDRNMVVIGAGAAGLVASYMGASSKAKVTLVEKNLMGGDCLNFGCVPSKALIKTARMASDMRHGDEYGLKSVTPEFDLANISQRITDIVAAIEPNDSVERYEAMGVDVALGHARIVDPWRVEIVPNDGEAYVLTTRSIVIATGAEPFVPPISGLADVDYLTSDNLWKALSEWTKLPEKLLVLGGGNIGVELAQAFARLGVNVQLVEMADRLLMREDAEVSKAAQASLEADGVKVLTGHQAVEFGDGICQIEQNGQRSEIAFDAVLVAVGRKARLEGFGLEELGIRHDRTIQANRHLATNFPNIFVAGDVVAPYQLTHTAAYEGTYAALNALFGQIWKFKMDYRVVPAVTFLDPEIARVGLNEAEAKAQGLDYEVTHYPLAKLDRAETETATEGFIKILTVKGKDRILGVTIVGEHAGEMLAEFTLAMKYKIGLRKILGTIHPYPTWSESAKNAAGVWSNAHLSTRATKFSQAYLKWLRK